MSESFPLVTYNFSIDNFSVIEDFLPTDEDEPNTSSGYYTTMVSFLTLYSSFTNVYMCDFTVWITHGLQ